MTPASGAARGSLVDALWRVALRGAYAGMRLYWFAFRPTTHGVYVAVWQRGRVLLIQNSYKDHASLPGGGIGRGEAAGEAALRELREEVGLVLEADALRRAGEWRAFHTHHEERGSFFECELVGEPAVRVDRREVVAARFETPEAALERPLAPLVRRYLEERKARSGPVA